MAFDSSADQLDDDQKNSATTGAGQSPDQQSTQLSGGGGGFAGQAGSAQGGGAAAPSVQSPTHSGSWTNLNSYLSANQDQGQQLGQQVASNVAGQAQGAQDANNSLVQGYKSQAPFSAINSTTDQNVSQAFQDPSVYAGGANPQDTTTPLSYLNNNWGLNSTNQNITQYSDPNNANNNWGALNDQYAQAGTALQNTQTETGRDQLLQNQYSGNGQQYGAGEQNFDQLLLQQNPNNQSALNSVYQQYFPGVVSQVGGTAADLSNDLTNSAAYNQAEQTRAGDIQSAATGYLGNDISNLGTGVANDVASKNSAYSTDAKNLLYGLTNGSPSQAGLNALGIKDPHMDIYGLNPADYANTSFNYNPYTANTAASTAEQGQYAGLNALLSGYTGANQGADQTQLQGIGLTNPASVAPVADVSTAFNSKDFLGAVNNAQTAYNDQVNKSGQVQAVPTFNSFVGKINFPGDPGAGAAPDQQANYYSKFFASPAGQQALANNPVQYQPLYAAVQQFNKSNTYLDQSVSRDPGNGEIAYDPATGKPITPRSPLAPGLGGLGSVR